MPRFTNKDEGITYESAFSREREWYQWKAEKFLYMIVWSPVITHCRRNSNAVRKIQKLFKII